MEEKQLKNEAVKVWLDDLRDLIYDVDDILDKEGRSVVSLTLGTIHEIFPKHNLSKKLTGWLSKLLSAAGWEVLIKEVAQAIPLSPRNHDDRWIWSGDKKGQFIVKSAYHIARSRILDDHQGIPNSSAILWNQIWKAPVPGNVQICAWNAASNILPTRSRLSQKGIDIDTQCTFCEEEVESPIHALHDCTHAAKVVPMTIGWWADYKSARLCSASPIVQGRTSRWTKPPVGFIKLNVDAAFDLESGLTGLGGIFSKMAIEHQLTPLIVETDCKDLALAINGSSLDNFELGFLLHDLRDLLHEALAARVAFGRRTTNQVAHILAQEDKLDQFVLDFENTRTVSENKVPNSATSNFFS
ncbi:uncharacterized protein LOC133737376 [Rosa rugosa]|uniref:uncharacterized protein LOC133737376 n=1 Tax=Rosa rugosa TaxID=74645 RepID=UPI002B401DA5|nr:uncharacterized protein LOC133737376 [Rosa rugosa]